MYKQVHLIFLLYYSSLSNVVRIDLLESFITNLKEYISQYIYFHLRLAVSAGVRG